MCVQVSYIDRISCFVASIKNIEFFSLKFIFVNYYSLTLSFPYYEMKTNINFCLIFCKITIFIYWQSNYIKKFNAFSFQIAISRFSIDYV
jgi:hypothetical protein